MKHLLFQLSAPLLSFGSPGAKLDRATDSHPGKGFALGLLGAALGKKRDDPWHDLSKDWGFGSLTVRAGSRVEDYHTVATPRTKDPFPTRREEVESADYTVETWREYLSDGLFILAFWSDTADFVEIAEALERPTFEIFAGRKSCPLSLPPFPLLFAESTLAEAFKLYAKTLYEPLRPKEGDALQAYWGDHPDPGLESDRSSLRKDNVVNRQKRLFGQRVEFEGSLIL